MARVRWGVLSTASIGRLVIETTSVADHAEVVAVASRDAAPPSPGAANRRSIVPTRSPRRP